MSYLLDEKEQTAILGGVRAGAFMHKGQIVPYFEDALNIVQAQKIVNLIDDQLHRYPCGECDYKLHIDTEWWLGFKKEVEWANKKR